MPDLRLVPGSRRGSSNLRALLEDEVCQYLYRVPGDAKAFDPELFRGAAREFVELLQFAPTLAKARVPVVYIDGITTHRPTRERNAVMDYAIAIHRAQRHRRFHSTVEQMVAALEQLQELEQLLSPRKPVHERHLDRAFDRSRKKSAGAETHA